MTPRLLLVEDEAAIRLALSGLLRREGYEVVIAESGDAAFDALAGAPFDLVLTDLALGRGASGLDVLRRAKELRPETAVVMITAHGNEKIAVEAMKAGAEDYVPKPFDNDEIRVVVSRALERTRLEREHRLLLDRIDRELRFENLIGSGPAMRRVFETIQRVAETDLTVLVRGESGTGKELVAQALHQRSARRARPFVAVNCAAISRELVESELFGHEKGAFTGADARRVGRFEAAAGGTIFLDEIGDMAPETQAKVVEITLPPLRARPEDVPALADRFLGQLAERLGREPRRLSATALARLAAYAWPGNVRELRNAIEQAAVLAAGDEIGPDDLRLANGAPSPAVEPDASGETFGDAKRRATERFERAYLLGALRRHGGNVSRTAEAIGMVRQSLQQKIRELGLRDADWSGDEG